MKLLSIRSHEPEGYYCPYCGQKNWPGQPCSNRTCAYHPAPERNDPGPSGL